MDSHVHEVTLHLLHVLSVRVGGRVPADYEDVPDGRDLSRALLDALKLPVESSLEPHHQRHTFLLAHSRALHRLVPAVTQRLLTVNGNTNLRCVLYVLEVHGAPRTHHHRIHLSLRWVAIAYVHPDY